MIDSNKENECDIRKKIILAGITSLIVLILFVISIILFIYTPITFVTLIVLIFLPIILYESSYVILVIYRRQCISFISLIKRMYSPLIRVVGFPFYSFKYLVILMIMYIIVLTYDNEILLNIAKIRNTLLLGVGVFILFIITTIYLTIKMYRELPFISTENRKKFFTKMKNSKSVKIITMVSSFMLSFIITTIMSAIALSSLGISPWFIDKNSICYMITVYVLVVHPVLYIISISPSK